MENLFNSDMVILILLCAVATFAPRIGGYVLIPRLKSIPPRLDAALNAVAPAFFAGGIEVKVAMAVALVIGLRFSAMPMLAIGWLVVMGFRHILN